MKTAMILAPQHSAFVPLKSHVKNIKYWWMTMHNSRNTMQKLAHYFILLGAALTLIGSPATLAATVPQPTAATATQLPDGRYLIAGGEVNQKPSKQLSIFDAKTQQTVELPTKLSTSRKNHSATLLPDGRIFIYGGVGADNITVGSAELLDPVTGKLSTLAAPGLVARSQHSATLLTNGKLLIAGGLSNRGRILDQAELWDPRSGQAVPVARSGALERSDTEARLLPDGNVLYQGGLDRNRNPLTNNLLFNAETERFEEISLSESASLVRVADSQKSLVVTTTIPPAEVSDFLPGGLITLRFSQPIDVTTANSNNVVLIGPTGAVAAKVMPSQDGMLAFLTPNIDLFPATRYTLIVKGISDYTGQVLRFDALGFNTASLAPGASSLDGNITLGSFTSGNNGAGNPGASGTTDATSPRANPNSAAANESADDEIFTPGAEHMGGRWRMGREMPREMTKRHNAAMTKKGDLAYESEAKKRPKSPMRAKVAAGNGTPGIIGQVLRINDKPLANVNIAVAGQTTQTDAQGRFQIDNVAPGHYELFVDGTRGGNRGRQYAKFVIGVDVEAGKTTDMREVLIDTACESASTATPDGAGGHTSTSITRAFLFPRLFRGVTHFSTCLLRTVTRTTVGLISNNDLMNQRFVVLTAKNFIRHRHGRR